MVRLRAYPAMVVDREAQRVLSSLELSVGSGREIVFPAPLLEYIRGKAELQVLVRE